MKTVVLDNRCLNCSGDIWREPKQITQAKRCGYSIKYCTDICRRKYESEHKKSRRDIWNKYNQKTTTKLKKRMWHEERLFDGNATILNQECFKCSSDEDLIIHHIDGNNGRMGKPLNNAAENLLVLCRRCHPTVHNRWGIERSVVSSV